MTRCCSQCGSNGHNSRTCGGRTGGGGSLPASSGGGDEAPHNNNKSSNSNSGDVSEIMLFGVRVKVDPMRKCVSMNNLSDYQHHPPNNHPLSPNKPADDVDVDDDALVASAAAGGYASADDAVHPNHSTSTTTAGVSRERKRGVAWTEEEHKLFLIGLQKVGKGDWRGISRNFVKTRNPTQVASHAQKYFLRKSNLNRRRRRSSLFDISPDSVTGMSMEEGSSNQKDQTAQAALPATSLPPHEHYGVSGGYAVAPFPVTIGPYLVPMQVQNPLSNMTLYQPDNFNNNRSAFLVRPVAVPVPVIPVPNSTPGAVISLNQRVAAEQLPLSLRLSLSSSDQNQLSTRQSSYQVMSSFNNGDSSSISVA